MIAIDPNNGEILAMVSHPNPDPNQLLTQIDPNYYQALLHDPNHPLFNRALSGRYPPGSTIKPLLALQALTHGDIHATTHIKDHGYFQLPFARHRFRDWAPRGHGTVNVSKAIIQSCDTFFYWLANKMGIQAIDHILQQFGLGKIPSIDITPRLKGVLNSPQWKRQHQQTPWYPGDTLISGIGQGNMLVTPLQMAQVASLLAMRGHGYQPHLGLALIGTNNQRHAISCKARPHH